MAKKRLTSDSVSNPLSESAFFNRPSEEAINRTTTRKNNIPNNRTGNKKKGVGRPPLERSTTRQSYEIYEDQLIALRRLRSMLELETGQKVSMSGLVREAIDAMLQERSR